MNINVRDKRKTVFFWLPFCLLLCGLAAVGFAVPKNAALAAAETPTPAAARQPFKALFIGNSHTQDGTAYIYDIAAAVGYQDVVVGCAYVNSATIEDHLFNARSDSAVYTYRKDKNGARTSAKRAISAMVKNEPWDVIFLQEQSSRAGQAEFYDNVPELVGILRGLSGNPDLRIGWYMTWAYASGSNQTGFEVFRNDQMVMYNAVANAVQGRIRAGLPGAPVDFVAPVGTVVQNARTSYMGDTLNRDGSHLSRPDGQYLAGLCFIRFITGDSLYGWDAVMPGNVTALPPDHWPAFREAVEDAAYNPFRVTMSTRLQAPPRTVIYPLNQRDISASFATTVYAYNAKAHTPTPVITHGAKTLRQGVDFEVEYRNNTNAGTATAIVSGMGYYSGSATLHFTVTSKGIEYLTLPDLPDAEYTGKPIVPAVTLKDGSRKLVLGTDYSLSCQDNVNAGFSTVFFKGEGNYIGTVAKIFQIKRKSLKTLSFAAISPMTYTGKALRPKIAIQGAKTALANGVDYTAVWKNNLKAGKATVTLSGTGNYSGKKTLSFRVLPVQAKTLRIANIPNKAYTGKAIKPRPAVKYGKKKLKRKRDYTLSYQNNIRAGTATVTVTCKGNYEGTATATFRIR